MNEQQRIGLAIALCMSIFLVFKGFMPAPPPPVRPAPTTAQAPAGAPSAPPPGAVAPATPGGAPAVTQTLPFATTWGEGRLALSRAGLSALTLRGFHVQGSADEPAESKPPLSLAGDESADGLQAQLLLPGGAEVEWRQRPASPGAGEGALGLEAEVGGRTVQLDVAPRAAGSATDYTLRLAGAPGGGAGEVPLAFSLRLSLKTPPQSASRGLFSMFTVPQAEAAPLNALCAVGKRVRRLDEGEVRKKRPGFMDDRIGWAGIDKQYFLVAASATTTPFTACQMRADDGLMTVDLSLPSLAASAAAPAEFRYTLLLGPKRQGVLTEVAPQLQEALDYTVLGVPLGFLARPMVFLLHHFHALTHSWGVAIALLTLVVKSLLFPVTYKSIISMRRMQAIKPQLDKLRETWAHDPERQSREQVKLLQENNANPLGGCLPALLQMPVWLALYNMLRHAVDLYQQPFLWLTDLTMPEPFPILALSVGALTLVQQKMTPVAMDGMQAKVMMYLLPVMFTVFMFAMPSGLVVYILVNSVLTIAQQVAINRFSAAK